MCAEQSGNAWKLETNATDVNKDCTGANAKRRRHTQEDETPQRGARKPTKEPRTNIYNNRNHLQMVQPIQDAP